ncbi:MAG: asparagine synthase (glutamine-hydrolyzing) [Balneolaceae bacterium]|nr:asparagine synthase (glutamine-hydrolyzing) [Balneolaceae bacterium]MBO6546049.1 asparagine synthase (glutamine-hydrolyzing) [Balneolaceae bacterium]MBO6647445.1 asparagine synthase (glutamine-hydrolyzing) [Balneolaceae bacterium]
MCGIHGFIDIKLSNESQKHVIKKMLASTSHRGPDFSDHHIIKEVVLGHNRLSIIDLSKDANQPFIKHGLVLVFNGEVYNFIELRKELEKEHVHFKTNSDTEVVLESYKKWGEECVNKFMGMWAFAIWDSKNNKLFCSRDRFGIKPFYYCFINGRFYFSSEVKALKNSPIFTNDLNLNTVNRAMQLGWSHFRDETFFSSVSSLEAGYNLTFKDHSITTNKYWNLSPENSLVNDVDEMVTEFRSLFDNSLKAHVRSDVPVGATLSGGIDSSSIVSSVIDKSLIPDLNTFSVYYQGNKSVDERPFINEIVQKYPDTFKTYYISPTESEVSEEFYKATFHNDFPILGSSPLSQYFVMKLIASKDIKVVLSGQGADDFLGGYSHAYYRMYSEYIKSLNLKKAFTELSAQKKRQGYNLSKLLDVVAKSALSLMFNEEQLYQIEQNYFFPKALVQKNPKNKLFNPGFTKFSALHYQLMTTASLPTLLHYEDRNSMAFSVESRVPFLDHRLVEYSFKLPTEVKIRNGWTKWILREAMKQRLPEKIYQRTDKKGFVTPGEVLWLRGKLDFLLDIDFDHLDFLNQKKISREIDDFKKGNDKNAKFIWRIANLNYWIKNFT